MPQLELDRSALKARNKFLVMFWIHTILDTILVATARDLWAIGRIAIAIIVMFFALQGRKWAKWVLVSLFSFLIVALMALVIALYSKLSPFLIVGSVILSLLSGVIITYIIRSQDLNRYFSYQKSSSS